jgi:hypothetical protein
LHNECPVSGNACSTNYRPSMKKIIDEKNKIIYKF